MVPIRQRKRRSGAGLGAGRVRWSAHAARRCRRWWGAPRRRPSKRAHRRSSGRGRPWRAATRRQPRRSLAQPGSPRTRGPGHVLRADSDSSVDLQVRLVSPTPGVVEVGERVGERVSVGHIVDIDQFPADSASAEAGGFALDIVDKRAAGDGHGLFLSVTTFTVRSVLWHGYLSPERPTRLLPAGGLVFRRHRTDEPDASVALFVAMEQRTEKLFCDSATNSRHGRLPARLHHR